MAKFIKVFDGKQLIGDVQTVDIEDDAIITIKIADAAITTYKLKSALVPYIGVYGYAEYGRSVYNFT